jgi:hypothetical protein
LIRSAANHFGGGSKLPLFFVGGSKLPVGRKCSSIGQTEDYTGAMTIPLFFFCQWQQAAEGLFLFVGGSKLPVTCRSCG